MSLAGHVASIPKTSTPLSLVGNLKESLTENKIKMMGLAGMWQALSDNCSFHSPKTARDHAGNHGVDMGAILKRIIEKRLL
jgi:hypothetical protein